MDAPAGTTGNWKFVVFTTPLDTVVQVQPTVDLYGLSDSRAVYTTSAQVVDGQSNLFAGVANAADNPTNPYLIGALNIWKWNSDTTKDFFPDGQSSDFVPPTSVETFGILSDTPFPQVPSAYTGIGTSNLLYRTLSSGFEITNTTATIYQQGLLTGVRVSSECSEGIYTTFGNGRPFNALASAGHWYGDYSSSRFVTMPFPPKTISEARNSGAIQHAAKLGAYSVDAYNYDKCSYTMEFPQHIRFTTGEPSFVTASSLGAGKSTSFSTISQLCTSSVNDVVTCSYSGVPVHLSQRSITAVYGTGLSANSTFNLAYNAYVQMSPRMQDLEFRSLVPLKKSPCTYDPRALALAHAGQRSLPYMVPVGMNAKGDFWSNIFDTAIDIAKVAVPALFPAASWVAPALTAGAPLVKRLVNNVSRAGEPVKTAKKKKTKKPDRKSVV